MGLVKKVIREWEDNNSLIESKIALGEKKAGWKDVDSYGFEEVDSEDKSLFDPALSALVWPVYIMAHPIKFSKAYWYSLKEIYNPGD